MNRDVRLLLVAPLVAALGCDVYSPVFLRDAGADVGTVGDAGSGPWDSEVDAEVDASTLSDARVEDAEMPDAGPWCPPSASVCDDFESGRVDNPPWDFSMNPRWSTSRSHRGERSLYVNGSSNEDSSFLAFENRLAPSTLHFRFWVYVPESARIDDVVLLQLSTESADLALQAAADRWVFRDNRTTGTGHVGVDVPRDLWSCISLQVSTGESSRVSLDVDGTRSLDRPLTPALVQNEIRFISVGLVYAGLSQDGSFEAFVDDFVWSDQPLACP